MNFGLSSRIRSSRSAPRTSGAATTTETSRKLRNFRFNSFALLFGPGLLPFSWWRLPVRKQCDERSNDQDNAADPHPHRQRIVEDLDDRLFSISCCSGENDVHVISRGRVNRHFTCRLRFLSGPVYPAFRIKVRNLLAVSEQAHCRFV